MERLTREQVIEKLEKGEKDFSGLDLSGLDLRRLDLSILDLSYCELSDTNLSLANLSYSKLSYCNLSSANLFFANLFNANLSNANLFSANLENTNLSCANLINANLSTANLFKTRLDEKEQIRNGLILKEPMIGYKKCIDDIIVTLEIPKGAIIFSINNSGCRTDKAKVIDISDDKKIAYSDFDDSFAYELDKEIEIEDFDLRYNVECSTGIHFFRTREEAESY